MKKLYLILFTLAFLLSTGKAISAQSQINTDTVIFTADNISANGGGLFTYSNQNSSVFGRLLDGNFAPGNCVCYAGTPLSLQSIYGGELSIRGGNPGLVNGNLYNQIFFTGDLSFDGGSYVLPFRYNRSRFEVTFPATLTASLNTYTANPFSQLTLPISTSQFNLQGTVTVSLQVDRIVETPNGVKPHFKIHQVKYNLSRAPQSGVADEESVNVSQ